MSLILIPPTTLNIRCFLKKYEYLSLSTWHRIGVLRSWLYEKTMITYSSGGHKSSRCQQDHVPFGGSRGEFTFLHFLPLEATCIPWLRALSSFVKACSVASSCLAFPQILTLPPPFYLLWPTHIILDNLPILQPLIQLCPQSPFCCKR